MLSHYAREEGEGGAHHITGPPSAALVDPWILVIVCLLLFLSFITPMVICTSESLSIVLTSQPL